MKEDKALRARLAAELREMDMRITARMLKTQPDAFPRNSSIRKTRPNHIPCVLTPALRDLPVGKADTRGYPGALS